MEFGEIEARVPLEHVGEDGVEVNDFERLVRKREAKPGNQRLARWIVSRVPDIQIDESEPRMVPLDILPAPLDGPLVHIHAPVFADVADFAQDADGSAPDTAFHDHDTGACRETHAQATPAR